MPARRRVPRRPRRGQFARSLTRQEFNQIHRNLNFEQCRIVQWARRSTRLMLWIMMIYGVNPQSRLFQIHLERHGILRFFIRLGVRPYFEPHRVYFRHLTFLLRESWRQCEAELARY